MYFTGGLRFSRPNGNAGDWSEEGLTTVESDWYGDDAFKSFLSLGTAINAEHHSLEHVDFAALLRTTPKAEIPSKRKRERGK